MPNIKKQRSLFSWGGTRNGSGRPNLSGAPTYAVRPDLSLRTPLHITFRLRPNLPNLRQKETFNNLKKAVKCSREKGLAVVHYCILKNHVHLIVETRSKKFLERGMKSLLGSLAKRLQSKQKLVLSNALQRRKEPLFFSARYHLHVLKTKREVKNALRYVLFNHEKHTRKQRYAYVPHSEFTSTFAFSAWDRLLGWKDGFEILKPPESLDITPARSWLLTVGWAQA